MDTVLRLLNEFKHKHVGYKIALKACCQLLFTYLTRGYKVNTEKTRKSQLKAERFKELLTRIEQSSAERIGLKEAASMVHMSPYHFCKTFKQYTGSSYVQFVNHRRVLTADKLLHETMLTITEISEQVGFANIHRFSKLYKQVKGYSPTGARK
jgi:transcriptional regulator GlxA family with amidase domain